MKNRDNYPGKQCTRWKGCV